MSATNYVHIFQPGEPRGEDKRTKRQRRKAKRVMLAIERGPLKSKFYLPSAHAWELFRKTFELEDRILWGAR